MNKFETISLKKVRIEKKITDHFPNELKWNSHSTEQLNELHFFLFGPPQIQGPAPLIFTLKKWWFYMIWDFGEILWNSEFNEIGQLDLWKLWNLP